MRWAFVILAMLSLTVLGLGCSKDQAPTPVGTQTSHEFEAAPPVQSIAPPQYFTTYWTARGFSMETIDVVHGVGVPYLDDVILDQPEGKGYTAGLGLTFDLDGSVYFINNWLFGPNPYLAELSKIDLQTGELTVIAEINNHFCGSEIDACGNLYTVGFQPPNPPNPELYFSPLYADKLCLIDKYTGAVTPIGNGTGLVDVMDLAFDSHGTLWATTDNKMYTIDLESGVATWVSDITNVPPAPPGEPYPMMIMSIAFDEHDVLYGTAIVGFSQTSVWISPIMRIDPYTGAGTLLGYSELGYNHGGDTMPATVRVAHRLGNGTFRCINISMSALAKHLAHGDYVPGTAGHDCNCPDPKAPTVTE